MKIFFLHILKDKRMSIGMIFSRLHEVGDGQPFSQVGVDGVDAVDDHDDGDG